MDAISPQDRDLAIRTIMGEEGSPEGQAGVAAVILNRLRGGYGQSLSDVVLAPGQFEPWSARTDELLGYSPRDPKYRAAGELLDALAAGKLPDPTGGATHFYAPRAQAALGRGAPAWGAGKPLAVLGGTSFYAPQGAVKQSRQDGGGAFFIGDSIADGLKTAAGGQGNTKVGRSPQAVAEAIANTDPRDFQGKTIYLSTGLSNAPKAIGSVANQIALLQARGVDPKNIRLVGVGDRPDFSGLNDHLAQAASQTGAAFMGPLDPASLSNDRVHPKDYVSLLSRGEGGAGDAGSSESIRKQVQTERIAQPKVPSWMPAGSRIVSEPRAIPGSMAVRPAGMQQPAQEALHDRPPPPSMPPPPEAGTAAYERQKPPKMVLGGEFAGDTQRLKTLYGEKLKEARHGYAGDVEAGRESVLNARGPLDVLSGAARYGYGKIGEAIAQPVAGASAALQMFGEPSGAGLVPEAAGGKVDLKVNTPEVPAWMPEGSKVVQPGKEAMPVAGYESVPNPVESSPPPVSGTGGAPPEVPAWMPEGSKVVSPGATSPVTGEPTKVLYGTEPPNVDPAAKAGEPLDIRPKANRPIVEQTQDFSKMPAQQKLQGVVDDLAKRFGIEVPISVETGEKLSRGVGGRARAEISGQGKATQKIFSHSIEVDHTLPPEQQLAIATHEFGHIVQWNKFHQLPASEQVAIRRAWAEDVAKGASITGPLDFEARSDFVSGQYGAPLSDTLLGMRRRLSEKDERYSLHPDADDVRYYTTFDEWFANQVSKFLTTNREAVTMSEKFFKGVADMWRKLYETFTGRVGAVPEMEAFLRREGKFFEDQPKTTPKDEDPFEPRARQPQPVGAGVPSAPPQLPDVPTRAIVREQEDRFNVLRKSATADKAEFTNRIKAMPPEMRNPAMQEKFYHYMEDPSVPLTPQEKALYDQYVAPLKREELALWEEAKNTDLPVEDFDPQYAHRIVKGRAPQFDALAGASEVANPIGGMRSLPKTTSSMKDRVFFAIQGFDGTRKLVAKSDDGTLRIIEKGQPAVPIKLPKDFKPGDNFFYDKQGWTVTQAKTPEIEANTDLTYYKNAVANTVDNIARLRVVVRAINEVKRLTSSPEWQAYAKRYDAKDVPTDWREPTMPLFRGWKVQPKLAAAIDDFYGHRSSGSLVDTLARINTLAVGSLFWSPVVHIYNVGTHWWTAKGFDLVTPAGMRSSAVDGAKAIYQVVTQGEKYQDLLRHGSGLIYGAVANQDFYRNMMTRLGEDIKRQPAKWDPIARTLGVGPSDLARMIYRGSSRALWAASDAFMMQRVLELERKGMSTRDAIAEAERHIPNYRVPSEVMRSRAVSQIMQNPSLTEFSRYHYGMMKSYGEMAKDLFGPPRKNPLGESRRIEGIGNFMALGAMMAVAWPAMNWAIQTVTGDKDLKLGPRGAMTLAYPLVDKVMQAKWVREHAPQYLLDYYNGDADVLITVANLVAMAPVLRTGLEAMPGINREFFSGRAVAEPADVRAGRWPRVVGQEVEHVAKNLVQPYDALTRAARDGKGAVKAMVEQGLGISEPNRAGRAKVFKRQAQDAKQRQKKPQGPLEQVFNALGVSLPPWLGGTQ